MHNAWRKNGRGKRGSGERIERGEKHLAVIVAQTSRRTKNPNFFFFAVATRTLYERNIK